MSAPLKKSNSRSTRKTGLAVLAVLAVLLVVFVTLKLISDHKKTVSGPIKTVPATDSSRKSAAKSDSAPKLVTDKFAASTGPATGTPSTTGVELTAPYGSLVSNHKPGQNDTGTLEQSQCITTPGASCSMKFTKGDTVKTLPAQTTDQTGVTYWNWDAKDLASGEWQITATAKLNDQTKSTTDQLALEIQ